MSWRNKKPERGYGRYRGRGGSRQHRGDEDAEQRVSETENQNSDHKQQSGYRGGRGGGHRGNSYKRHTQSGHSSYDVKRSRYKVGERLKEEDVGVTEFVGSHKRFVGILKERFSDFHVHEISPEDEICKLTNQDIPPDAGDLRDYAELTESLPAEVLEKLEAFAKPSGDAGPTEIDVTDMDKETRKRIHTTAKRLPSVNSETKERDDRKIIVLSRWKERAARQVREDRREDWSSREGNYCRFRLHKVNMDTMDALNQLALKLRIRANLFHYAGTKDRRAHTTQWVSLKKVSPGNIHAAARQVRGAYVGNFQFSKDPLKLGTLNGNHFRIALRSVDGTDEEIERAMTSLRDNGFINYYGLQRFGSIAAIPTHEIGKALLQGKWREAIELILKPRVGEQHRDMTTAREIYQKTKDAASALRPITRSGKVEATLLRGLVKAGENNPQGALDHIPRNARLMYIHSYQSFVWNHMVTRRVKEFGPKPIVGDLVYEKNDPKSATETMDYPLPRDEPKDVDFPKPKVAAKTEQSARNNDEQPIDEAARHDGDPIGEKANVKADNETIDDPISGEAKINAENETVDDSEGGEAKTENETVEDSKSGEAEIKTENETIDDSIGEEAKAETESETLDDPRDEFNLPAVKILTEEDLSSYTLADVVMPKPGWKVTYPAYAKAWYDEFLAKDDLTTDLRQKNKKYSLGGGYRKILETPGALTWKIVHYNGYHDDLIMSDVDEMRGLDPPKVGTEGKHKALILEFSLSSSTYATMALREILEIGTSAHAQATRSAANQAQDSANDNADKMETEVQLVAEGIGVLGEVANTDKMDADKTNEESKDKPEVIGEPDVSKVAEKKAEQGDESVMDVAVDEPENPKVDEAQKMETEAPPSQDIEEKEANDA